MRKKEIIPNAVPTVLIAWANAPLEPKIKVVARVKATNKTVPITETNKGVVLIKMALVLSLKIGVSTKLVYL
jgi:hypothetical protein